MVRTFKKISHSIYEHKYHIVFCPKYRYRILKGEIAGFANRHIRLCNQIPGAAKFAQAIKPKYNLLIEKHKAVKAAVDNRIDACDDMLLQDRGVDNEVRTGFEKCIQHDREHPNEPVLRSIFSDEKFGDIIHKNRQKELNSIEQLIVKFEALGEKHPLYAVAEDLKKGMAKLRKATAVFNEAVRAEKIALAEEDVAREELCAAYEANYLDARKGVSREFANSLFPRLNHKKIPSEAIPQVVDSAAA